MTTPQPQSQEPITTGHTELPAAPTQRPFRLPGTRRVDAWNAYWHLLYRGSDAEKEEWTATVRRADENPSTSFTKDDVKAGFRRLNVEQIKKLQKKASELERAKLRPVVGTNARKAVAKMYRRKFEVLLSQMHAQLGWDAAVIFSSKDRSEHGKPTSAITTGKTATDALQSMRDVHNFNKFCRDKKGAFVEAAGPALGRSSTALKHAISKGMRKLFAEVPGGSEVKSFPWSKFVREQRGDEEEGFWYRSDNLAIVGFDFESPTPRNPSARGVTAAYLSSLAEALENKTVKIVNVNTQ